MTASTLERIVIRDIGADVFKIIADTRFKAHPISMHLGPAAIVLSRSEALRIARALVDAAQFLPKG